MTLRKKYLGAGERAHWCRALLSLTDDLQFGSQQPYSGSQPFTSPFQGIWLSLLTTGGEICNSIQTPVRIQIRQKFKKNLKIKQQKTHLIGQPASKTRTSQNANYNLEQWRIAGGNSNCSAYGEQNFTMYYKIKYSLTIWSSNHTFWHLPKSGKT